MINKKSKDLAILLVTDLFGMVSENVTLFNGEIVTSNDRG